MSAQDVRDKRRQKLLEREAKQNIERREAANPKNKEDLSGI